MFRTLWETLVNYYNIYSDFVHSILPDQIGDLAVWVIDLAVVALIVWAIGKAAFGTKSGE